MTTFQFILAYCFLSYVVMAVIIDYHKKWPTEWDSTELQIYMISPLSVIIFIGFLVDRVRVHYGLSEANVRRPWLSIGLGFAAWLLVISFVYYLTPIV